MHFIYKGDYKGKDKINFILSKTQYAPKKKKKLYGHQIFFPKHSKVIMQLHVPKTAHILTREHSFHVTKMQAPYG